MITEWIAAGVLTSAYATTVVVIYRRMKAQGYNPLKNGDDWYPDDDNHRTSCGVCGSFSPQCGRRDCPWAVGPGGQKGEPGGSNFIYRKDRVIA